MNLTSLLDRGEAKRGWGGKAEPPDPHIMFHAGFQFQPALPVIQTDTSRPTVRAAHP